VTTVPVSADGQAIALACSPLAVAGDRSIKPLSAMEWHEVSIALRNSELERPRELIAMSPGDLRDALGLTPALAGRLSALLSRGGQLAFELERLASRGIWVLTRADDGYPWLLKQRLRGDTPPVLFGAGPLSALHRPGIAVVGSRDVDEDGLAWASGFGRRCAEQGFAVVSGAARGVDITAMTGALTYGGPAVGVTVDPLDRLVRRRDLREAITDELLTLVTPFVPTARWHAGNAMRRNRLIYALSHAAVVVASSAEKGGTRSGALENLRAGWVGLHVRDDGSRGNDRLIRDGAHPLPAHWPVEEIDVRRLVTEARPTLLDDMQLIERQEPAAAIAATKVSEPPAPPGGASPRSAEGGRPDPAHDAFLMVWPDLERHLFEPLSEREVAERLKLELTQARAWLKRAVNEGRAELTTRPKRYVARVGRAEQLRIDPR
jgi:predicted Rossmann fold nucleotide-binding protein DprA/Smf involved in DNA uptake